MKTIYSYSFSYYLADRDTGKIYLSRFRQWLAEAHEHLTKEAIRLIPKSTIELEDMRDGRSPPENGELYLCTDFDATADGLGSDVQTVCIFYAGEFYVMHSGNPLSAPGGISGSLLFDTNGNIIQDTNGNNIYVD